MADPLELWRDLNRYLEIRTTVSRWPGRQINVGERFEIRVRVTNTSTVATGSFPGPIWYKDIRLAVSGTGWAYPVDHLGRPTSALYFRRDTPLNAGLHFDTHVEMQAMATMSEPRDWFETEHVAHVKVTATLDPERFFRFITEADFHAEIDA